ncbi:hypothetical protein [Micromonospora sp. CA-248212]|uniref:hypothetical protein n=1 Tax=Micromonospora sp. CA-248212 TaxID=3239961 RepID=UPI003D91BCDC
MAALLALAVLVAREFVLEGREHRAANEQIGAEHRLPLWQAQAWQESCGAGTTMFPASHPRLPSRLAVWWGLTWSVLREQVSGGDRFAVPGGRHTPTVGWSPRDVARHLAARSYLTDGEVREIAEQEFAAGLNLERAPEVGVMPARLPWDVLDRASGKASVNRPFDEQIRDRNDVLHGRVRAAANSEATQFLPVVPSDGAR